MYIISRQMMIVTLTALAVLLGGCQTTDNGQQASSNETKKLIGTLIGAGLGAFLGSKFGGGQGQLAAVAIGALVGGYLANTLFEKLNQQDKQTHLNRRDVALREVPDGKSLRWENPDNLASGQIEPSSSYKNQQGVTCRDITETISVDGNEQSIRSSHCWDDTENRFKEATG